MVQYWYCFSKDLSVLFTAVSISLASTSSPSSFLISMTEKIARKCVVKYNSWRYDYYLYFDFHNKLNLNSSQWEFAIETCDSTFDNYFCLNWEVEERSSVCKITNISNRVLCIMRRIDPRDRALNSYRYKFYAKFNSTYFVNDTIFRLTSLQCECKDFHFDPNLNISISPSLGIAEVNIKPFLQPKSDILDFHMTITPNESLTIKKDGNNFKYKLSNLNSCQKYSVDIALELKDTTFKKKCENDWKMKPGIVEFQIPKLDVNKISCSYNLTHMNLTSTSPFNSYFYYNLSFGDESFMIHFTNNTSFVFTKAVNIILAKNNGFVSLCSINCKKCGIKHAVICFSNIQSHAVQTKDVNVKSSSVSTMLIFSIIAVVLFAIVLFAAVKWRRYCSRNRKGIISGLEVIAPRSNDQNSNDSLNNLPVSETVEPVYEEIKENHLYDKLEVKLESSSVLSGVNDREENHDEFLDQEGIHCERIKNFLSCTQN